jgi:thymidylate synthase (FAD)
MKIVEQSVTLEWITPNPQEMIERAGRTCYKSEDKITESSAYDFCYKMNTSGHHAMLEHASASFRIICDRGVSHEIVRHRIASYAQESTRYCNYSKEKFGQEISVIEPPNLTGDARLFWVAACQEAESSYFGMLLHRVSPQIARSVLPTCLKTEIIMTANLREFMHFVKLRSSPAAHPQIRPIALAINNILAKEVPSLFTPLNN